MPSSSKLSHYPKEFLEIAAADDGVFPTKQTFTTQKDAERARFQWYYFCRALRISQHPLVERAERFTLTIEGTTLIMSIRGFNGFEEILRAVRTKPLAVELPTTQSEEDIAMEEFRRRIAEDAPRLLAEQQSRLDDKRLLDLAFGKPVESSNPGIIKNIIPAETPQDFLNLDKTTVDNETPLFDYSKPAVAAPDAIDPHAKPKVEDK